MVKLQICMKTNTGSLVTVLAEEARTGVGAEPNGSMPMLLLAAKCGEGAGDVEFIEKKSASANELSWLRAVLKGATLTLLKPSANMSNALADVDTGVMEAFGEAAVVGAEFVAPNRSIMSFRPFEPEPEPCVERLEAVGVDAALKLNESPNMSTSATLIGAGAAGAGDFAGEPGVSKSNGKLLFPPAAVLRGEVVEFADLGDVDWGESFELVSLRLPGVEALGACFRELSISGV